MTTGSANSLAARSNLPLTIARLACCFRLPASMGDIAVDCDQLVRIVQCQVLLVWDSALVSPSGDDKVEHCPQIERVPGVLRQELRRLQEALADLQIALDDTQLQHPTLAKLISGQDL